VQVKSKYIYLLASSNLYYILRKEAVNSPITYINKIYVICYWEMHDKITIDLYLLGA